MMLLIDSLYINNSGGLRLLDLLVNEMIMQEVDFYLLADKRCQGRYKGINVCYKKASLKKRKEFYKAHRNNFTSVLCFGNIPTPIKLNVPVYTYFHNINLLTLAEAHSLSEKITMWLKRQVFRHYKKNTDFWLVQTSNTSQELCKHLYESSERVKLMPFFELPNRLNELKNEKHGDEYVFVSNYTGAKGHEELLNAWALLHKQGINRKLHLTVPYECEDFCRKIKQAQEEGVMVINHGIIPFDKVMELYRKSKAIIYPSHNESLGLGIVEAITAGCDVIGANLPYMYAVCKPSQVFNPYSSESIMDAVTRYENGENEKSELLIYNHIEELIKLLCNNSHK